MSIIQPVTIQDFAAVYHSGDGGAHSFLLPAGSTLARVDGGGESPVEYVVRDPSLLRSKVGHAYDRNQPYCFIPEEVANVSVLSQDSPFLNVETSMDVPWSGATIGYFDPMARCRKMYGLLPGPAAASKGCARVFGASIPRERRHWEWSEYSLRTGMDGLLLDIRSRLPDSHGRRLGYLATFGLTKLLDQEMQKMRTEHGVRLQPWKMPEGTLCHRASAAMDLAVEAFASACGLEKLPKPPTPFAP